MESPEQVLETAQQIRANAPISLLRGGVWKPRTKPGSFEGVGAQAMRWLIDAGKAINTPTTVEVANAEHVELALKEGADVLWIGARTTVNPFYVQEIAEALKGVNIPVLVKNPIHAEIGLWAGAIERFQKAGTKRIAAVHRGFFSTAKSIYRNEPEWQHSFDLRALMPEIKIICDPSHIAGDRSLIKEVSQVAMDLGMEGLMIETHRDPRLRLERCQATDHPGQAGRDYTRAENSHRGTLTTQCGTRHPARGTRCLGRCHCGCTPKEVCQGQGHRCHQRARGTEHLPHGTVVKIGPRANF